MTDDDSPQVENPRSGNAVDTIGQGVLSPRCPACGRPEQIIWVHGHGQCSHCCTNVMPCCDGAVFDNF